MKDISIIIVNYHMKARIQTCLASLHTEIANTTRSVHIVIIDNSQNADGIQEWLTQTYPTVHYINPHQNVGFGKATNIGIASCDASYYFVLNPDTECLKEQKTLERLYAFMEKEKKVGMVGPKIVYPDGSLQYSCYRFPTLFQPFYSRTSLGKKGKGKKIADHFLMKEFDHEKTIPVDWIMGSAMFVRKQAIDDVGVFDDRYFMYAEDADWCRRMWEAHWPVYYVHDIVLSHIHGRGSAKIPGVFNALLKNKLARIHLMSWFKYMWKWRHTTKHYTYT